MRSVISKAVGSGWLPKSRDLSSKSTFKTTSVLYSLGIADLDLDSPTFQSLVDECYVVFFRALCIRLKNATARHTELVQVGGAKLRVLQAIGMSTNLDRDPNINRMRLRVPRVARGLCSRHIGVLENGLSFDT